MIDWLAPAVGFVLLEGSLGITTKLALRGIGWQEMILWAAGVYAAVAIVLIVAGGFALPLRAGAGWAAISGLFAAGALILFFVALRGGPASQVVPVTAAYPAASTVFAAILLSEEIDLLRVTGTAMVVGGVIVLSRS
jgi:transporter family protein